MADSSTRKKSGNQKRRNKERNKKSAETKGAPSNETQSARSTEDEDSAESMQASFERELAWCIQQLELGLATQSLTSKQGQEYRKVLKSLKSATAPLPKKRQLMRLTFGDYRKKMAEEERKYETKHKKICLSAANEKQSKSSTFLKKSLKMQHEKPTDTNLVKTEMPSKDNGSSCATTNKTDNVSFESSSTNCFKFKHSQEQFKFNFGDPQVGDQTLETTQDENTERLQGVSIKEEESTPVEVGQVETKINYFKMEPSACNFTFNF